MKKLFLLSTMMVAFLTTARFSMAADGGLNSQSALVSEQAMLNYLAQGSTQNSACEYRPAHYIDLGADLFLIRAIIPTADPRMFSFRGLTANEAQQLVQAFGQIPVFKLSGDTLIPTFEPVRGASKKSLIEGMYRVKKALEKISPQLFIDSSRPCPAGVSVGNL